MLLTVKNVKENYKISHNTLLDWENKGLLLPIKTIGGHRRYEDDDIQRVLKINNKVEMLEPYLYLKFHNGQEFPSNIQIIGNIGISQDDAEWTPNLPKHHDDCDCLTFATYKKITKKRFREIKKINYGPPETIYLRGDEDTGIKINCNDKFCDFHSRDGIIQLYIGDILKYLCKPNKFINFPKIPYELPVCFITEEISIKNKSIVFSNKFFEIERIA